VIVTLVGIGFSAWFPAFTRQWDDRQKARELQAAVADSIAVATPSLSRQSTEYLGRAMRSARDSG
jgi:hypothetical protein